MCNRISFVAPTFSAVKGVLEVIFCWKSLHVRPTHRERDRKINHPGFPGKDVRPIAERGELN